MNVVDELQAVRLLVADVDTSNELLTDAQYEQLLELEDDNVWLAAAAALRIMATSETLVQKRIRLLDLQTDGPAVSAELRKIADGYEQRGESEAGITVGEWAVPPFGPQQRIVNELLRSLNDDDGDAA